MFVGPPVPSRRAPPTYSYGLAVRSHHGFTMNVPSVQTTSSQTGATGNGPAAFARLAVRREGNEEISEREVIEALGEFESPWDELFPAEQARIVRLLVERLDASSEGIAIRLRAEDLRTLVNELTLWEAA
jgi:acyl-CoA reductase-like NAD-dependent aldehyde dehydrogenase